jgi:uncharacterized protein YciI
MFIISLDYTKPLHEIDQLIEPHIDFLDKYYANNTFILSGRKVPRTGGIIIAKCDSKEQLEIILKEDPFYLAKAANYTITEMQVTKASEYSQSLLNC